MINKEKSDNLRNTYAQLHHLLMNADPSVDIKVARKMKNAVIRLMEDSYKTRFEQLNLFEPHGFVNIDNVMKATILFKDQLYKYTHDYNNDESAKVLKLLRARECDNEFEDYLAVMIVGDNDNFPYRSSFYITQFFQHLGFNETHDGSTRRIWTADVLRKHCIEDVYKIITQGLFKKKYFLEAKKDINIALEEFKKMLELCYSSVEVFDISSVFDFNINTEILFKEQCLSTDASLNELMDKSRDNYLRNDIQSAVEKIWDALERSKTILNTDKKDGINSLFEKCAVALEETFFNNEYRTLTDIGNTYQIRHFETDKTKIDDIDTLKYLYFRAFVLVNYAIKKLGLGEQVNLEVSDAK